MAPTLDTQGQYDHCRVAEFRRDGVRRSHRSPAGPVQGARRLLVPGVPVLSYVGNAYTIASAETGWGSPQVLPLEYQKLMAKNRIDYGNVTRQKIQLLAELSTINVGPELIGEVHRLKADGRSIRQISRRLQVPRSTAWSSRLSSARPRPTAL